MRANGTEQIEVVVVGAGQAGLAVSYYLRAFGVEHVVLERGRVIQFGVTSVNESHRADRQLSPTRPRSSTTCSTPNARR